MEISVFQLSQDEVREFSQAPFWFWNDELNEEEISRQLDEFQAHGVHAFVIHPRVGLPESLAGMSIRLLDYMRFAIEEAKQRNMWVILYDEGMFYPDTFVLKQNYPNPFNPTTKIEFELGTSNNIHLLIFDINGRKIKELANGYFNKGIHAFTWDSKDDLGNTVSSGMYIYSLISNDNISTQKMLLLK